MLVFFGLQPSCFVFECRQPGRHFHARARGLIRQFVDFAFQAPEGLAGSAAADFFDRRGHKCPQSVNGQRPDEPFGQPGRYARSRIW